MSFEHKSLHMRLQCDPIPPAFANRTDARSTADSHAVRECGLLAFPGELLAMLGPLHPSAIAFHRHALARPVVGALPADEQPPVAAPTSGKRSQAAGSHAGPWLGAALQQLHGFLTASDVGVIRMAQTVLRCATSSHH